MECFMSKAIFIFTFSPVQPFIAEARRAADLFTGSQILVELAKASAEAIQEAGGQLIYPSELTDDIPNKLVAQIEWEKTDLVVQAVLKGFQNKWEEISRSAHNRLVHKEIIDDVWESIWKRQVENQWETYWVAVEGENSAAMRSANQALEATKRTRSFPPSEEDGYKDSLSGCRSALRTQRLDAQAYWKKLALQYNPSKIKRNGREKLDAIGAIKRFSMIADVSFPSTSTIASSNTLAKILSDAKASAALKKYAEMIDRLGCFTTNTGPEWRYDGDLLYIETLTAKRLKDDYGLENVSQDILQRARKELLALYKLASRPSAYYALITLDGDSMGEYINQHEKLADHRELSHQIAEFSREVRLLGREDNGDFAHLIYNGGDDVLAMTPLCSAISFAQKVSKLYAGKVGRSASAGIAIIHHQYPLQAAIRAARWAEVYAKKMPQKSAVCVEVIKRSGVPYRMVSHWNDLDGRYEELVNLFSRGELSSGLTQEVIEQARIVSALKSDAQASMLKRLIHRHCSTDLSNEEEVVNSLAAWNQALDHTTEDGKDESGLEELGRWLSFARFVAQGGKEG
jgi:CRISPR-associated protein Cmr2